jgi:hypothetical protein
LLLLKLGGDDASREQLSNSKFRTKFGTVFATFFACVTVKKIRSILGVWKNHNFDLGEEMELSVLCFVSAT